MTTTKRDISLNKWVFFPPLFFLCVTIFYSICRKNSFLARSGTRRPDVQAGKHPAETMNVKNILGMKEAHKESRPYRAFIFQGIFVL